MFFESNYSDEILKMYLKYSTFYMTMLQQHTHFLKVIQFYCNTFNQHIVWWKTNIFDIKKTNQLFLVIHICLKKIFIII